MNQHAVGRLNDRALDQGIDDADIMIPAPLLDSAT